MEVGKNTSFLDCERKADHCYYRIVPQPGGNPESNIENESIEQINHSDVMDTSQQTPSLQSEFSATIAKPSRRRNSYESGTVTSTFCPEPARYSSERDLSEQMLRKKRSDSDHSYCGDIQQHTVKKARTQWLNDFMNVTDHTYMKKTRSNENNPQVSTQYIRTGQLQLSLGSSTNFSLPLHHSMRSLNLSNLPKDGISITPFKIPVNIVDGAVLLGDLSQGSTITDAFQESGSDPCLVKVDASSHLYSQTNTFSLPATGDLLTTTAPSTHVVESPKSAEQSVNVEIIQTSSCDLSKNCDATPVYILNEQEQLVETVQDDFVFQLSSSCETLSTAANDVNNVVTVQPSKEIVTADHSCHNPSKSVQCDLIFETGDFINTRRPTEGVQENSFVGKLNSVESVPRISERGCNEYVGNVSSKKNSKLSSSKVTKSKLSKNANSSGKKLVKNALTEVCKKIGNRKSNSSKSCKSASQTKPSCLSSNSGDIPSFNLSRDQSSDCDKNVINDNADNKTTAKSINDKSDDLVSSVEQEDILILNMQEMAVNECEVVTTNTVVSKKEQPLNLNTADKRQIKQHRKVRNRFELTNERAANLGPVVQAVITDHTYEEDRVCDQQVSIQRDHSYGSVHGSRRKAARNTPADMHQFGSLPCSWVKSMHNNKQAKALKTCRDIYSTDHNYEPTL